MTAPIRLFDQGHHAMSGLLATGAPVFLCVNPVEYHGPHLSLHNDRLISEGVARDLFERLRAHANADWPFLLGEDLEIGVDPAPGPGTRFTPFRRARRLVVEACDALAEAGAQRVVLVTWHGGALHGHALAAGAEHLRRRGVLAACPFEVLLHKLVDLGDPQEYADAVAVIADPTERADVLASLDLDFHAGFFETSLALHYAGDSVDPCFRALPDCPVWGTDRSLMALGRVVSRMGLTRIGTDIQFAARAAGWGALRPFPGYTGRPRHSDAEAGRCFAAHALDAFVPAIEASWRGEAPIGPTMGWLRTLTLGGLVPLGRNLRRDQVLPAPEPPTGP